MDISIVIVNFNTKSFLKLCLENLKDIGGEVVVVDNGSSDKSYEMVKKEFEWVTAIKEENHGISHGYNVGTINSSGKYILYLGTDAFPKKEDIEGIYKYMEKNSAVGISTPALVLDNGNLDFDAHRGFPTPWAAFTHFSSLNKAFKKSKIFNQYYLGYKNMTNPHEIDVCISHFMFVRREAYNKINGWDEDFFVFGEDVDFCYRMKQAGYKIMYLPNYRIKHLKGVSVGTRKTSSKITTATKETKRRMKKMSTSAMKLFYKKHYANKYPKVVTWSVIFGITILEKLRTL